MTEIIVVVGGLLVGYWLVNVFMPTIFHKEDSKEKYNSAEDQKKSEDDYSYSEDAREHSDDSSGNTLPLRSFEVLGISESSTPEQIVIAYKFQISQYHPDKVSRMGLEIRELAEEKSKAINAAYDEAMKHAARASKSM